MEHSFSRTWGRTTPLKYTEYTARSCDILESASPLQRDQILAWQVRVQRIIEETSDLSTEQIPAQTDYQIDLMIKGMQAQLTEWQTRVAPELSSNSE